MSSFVASLGMRPNGRIASKRCMSPDSASGERYGLITLGNAVVDLLIPMREFPVVSGGHQDLRGELIMSPGGAANALIIGSRMGLRTMAVDWIGRDGLGDFLIDRLQQIGIGTKALVRRDGASYACVILVSDKGEHTFIASNEKPTATYDPTINAEDAVAKLPSEFAAAISKADTLLLDGYALDDIPFSTLLGAINLAQQSNCSLWLDPQATAGFLNRSNPDLVKFLLQSMDGVALTHEELEDFTGLSTTEAVLDKYANLRYCVLKEGDKGCRIRDRDHAEEIQVPGINIGDEYRDSAGAGDSFIAAFIVCLLRGLKIEEAAVVANATGAATCTRPGAGENVAEISKVLEFLEKAGYNTISGKLRQRVLGRAVSTSPLGLRNNS